MNLYNMTTEYKQAIEKNIAAFEDGELGESFDDWLTDATNELNNKRLAVAAYIKTLEAEKEAMTHAAENIWERAIKKTNHIERLTEYLKRSMQQTETSLVNGVEFDIKLKTNPCKVVIHDEQAIPEKWKTKIESVFYRPDKKLIKESITAGEQVPGCELVQEERIEIK